MKKLSILGIRGVPASHGGFETFAENLSTYLAKKGWEVSVYCQVVEGTLSEDSWCGVRRVKVPVRGAGAISTIQFDLKSTLLAAKEEGIILTLGYNTALFSIVYRIVGKYNFINMDGIEWKRDKWSWYEKLWLYLNERAGCILGNHLIADHPEIENHLKTRVSSKKITMIPYGARSVHKPDESLLEKYNLKAGSYALIVARPEPENSILQIVSAFSKKNRDKKLVILGSYEENNSYHRKVLNAASDEIKFLGSVYDHQYLDTLRYYSCLYIHGHTVGGTNPSLIEALGSGQPVLAHDNKFNRWVAGEGASFFKDEQECSVVLDKLLTDKNRLSKKSRFSRQQFEKYFTWDAVLEQYENMLLRRE